MTIAKDIDYSTLRWVKQEIDETLDQARHALEDYVENADDPTQLRFCATYIHQVCGTLQMVELYGAALLAEEMEQLTGSLLDNTVEQKNDAYEVLMRAILQLPDYLERIQTGLNDDPLILLPLLNDLRAARGENLLSENALFAPDILAAEPIVLERRAADVEVCQLARKLRHQYQVGLLGWYRDRDPMGSLQKIRAVLEQLEQASKRNEVVRLWWVANGVIEALLERGLDSGVSLNLLLGQVDREIKRLIDKGEDEVAAKPATELLKNLLYYVARSESQGERISVVRQKFNLVGALPNADEIERARERLSGPNLAMMETVAEAIREDLASVKDALDLFLRSEERRTEELQSQTETLRKVADTLGMLGLGIPRKVIQDQGSIIRDILSGKIEATEARLMEIAGALLFAESSLDGLAEGGVADEGLADLGVEESKSVPGAEEAEQPVEVGAGVGIPEAEFRQIKAAVMKEVTTGIAQAKDSIVSFIDAPWDHALLTDVPLIFDQVRGAMQMISLDRPARLLTGINQYIVQHLLGQKRQPAPDELDTLADAISSIEYYLEEEQETRSKRDHILALAHESLEKLGFPVEAAEEPGSVGKAPGQDVATTAVSEQPPESEEIVLEALGPELEVPAAEEQQEAASPAQAVVPDEPLNAVQAGFQQPAATVTKPILEEVDEDILEIFIEEAQEELAVINEMLPKWKADTDDHDHLGRIRRTFHTLKGSGRLVGATEIGELAWAMENMLNRVLDNTISAAPEMIDLIEESAAVFPQLIEQLQGKPAADVDVQSLIDRAFGVVESQKAQQPRPEDYLVEEAEQAVAVPDEEAQPTEVMDPVLYEIFSKESTGHLAQLQQFINHCQGDAGRCGVTDVLVRSLHTLHGSARMAGADTIAELGGALEKYVKALMSNESPLHPEGMGVLVEGVDAIQALLGKLNQPDAALPGHEELLDRIYALYNVEQDKTEEKLKQEQGAALTASQGEGSTEEAGFDSELVEVFLEEGSELLDAGEMVLQRWRSEPDNQDLVAELQRQLHTLKGGARMAGITAVGDLSHHAESLLTDITEGRLPMAQAVADTLHRVLDRLFAMLERTQERRAVESAPDLIDELEDLRHGRVPEPVAAGPEGEMATVGTETEAMRSEREQQPSEPAQVVPFPAAPAGPREERRKGARVPQEMVRVRADLLDSLVNNAGEVSIYRSRLEQQNGAFRFNLIELEQTIARLRDQLRKLEIETEAQILYRYEQEGGEHEGFDPLEMDRYSHMQQLSRALLESVGDISSIQGLLDNLVRESETLLIQQARVNTDLQEGLMRTRMVPFTGLVPRMRRIVRQTCQELGKQAELHVIGAQGEMDRTVLDRIIAPLEHMLRNAISHGIESPEERQALGKPKIGNLTLSLAREGSEVVIQFADDGAGIDLDAIRAKAVERGLLDRSAELTGNDFMQFILESGFSTAEQVTQISGRGVGMDVVNSEIKQLGGSLHIDSRPEHGATFTIRLPLTLAVNQALLVGVAEDTYAIPLTGIEGIVRMSRDELESYFNDGKARYRYAEQDYQVRSLGLLLGSTSGQLPPGGRLFPVLLVRSGDHRMALQVDGLMGSREIVVKSVGPQLSTVRGISGATILGDGRVVLILDAGALIRLSAAAVQVLEPGVLHEKAEKTGVNVMVVDDSITVRKVTTRLLERNSMRVITAKDGVDAVALLQEHIPDIMLLDIEMPRMDGFELATHMRNEPRLKQIPIIMITSRTGDKHRRRAQEIGVDRYLGKPYQESDLLETMEELLKGQHGDT